VISPFDELVLPCYHAGLERIPIEGRLHELWQGERVAHHRRMEGRHDVCAGCTINCYFEPSFATSPGSPYFWEGLPSKARYAWTKFVVQRIRAKLGGPKAASTPRFRRGPSRRRAATGAAAPSEMIALPVLR
jgi:hypothetical protein